MSNFMPDKYGDKNRNRQKATTPIANDRTKLSSIGTVAGRSSEKILDNREHFPVDNENQAKSAVKRVGAMPQVPSWFSGSLEDLQKMVYLGVASKYPEIRIPIDLHLEAAMARLVKVESGSTILKVVASRHRKEKKMSDIRLDISGAFAILNGEGGVQDEKHSVTIDGVKIKNPEDNPTKVPGVSRKHLKSDAEYEDRHAIARSLMDMIEDKKKALKSAETVAKRLETKGLTAEEFKNLMLFIQEDILYELLRNGVKADNAEAMKRVLTNRKGSD